MRDIRQDWHDDTRTPRLDREFTLGARLIVACEAAGCDHAVLIDPGPLFGARRFWPVTGRSERFRCCCGSRETALSYTINTAKRDAPMSKDVIHLWT